MSNKEMWIFGYGSLIWKVDFPYETKLVGYVKGFTRRFYQHSIDHRGIPEKPGRVVTLLEATQDDEVYGVAYKIRDEDVDSVVSHLDMRERGGYNRTSATFHPRDVWKEPFDITIYIGTTDNAQYAGVSDMITISKQIFHAVGPSGTNKEYIYNLAQGMRDIAPEIDDEHLYVLEKMVLQLDNENL